MKAYIKLFCEVIPLIVFFLVNSYDKVILKEIPLEGIFQATFYFIIVSIVVIPIALVYRQKNTLDANCDGSLSYCIW